MIKRYGEHLEAALLISQLNEREKGDGGESARVMNKLAQAYLAKGLHDKASQMKKTADETYTALLATWEYARGTDEMPKWDYLICLKFR